MKYSNFISNFNSNIKLSLLSTLIVILAANSSSLLSMQKTKNNPSNNCMANKNTNNILKELENNPFSLDSQEMLNYLFIAIEENNLDLIKKIVTIEQSLNKKSFNINKNNINKNDIITKPAEKSNVDAFAKYFKEKSKKINIIINQNDFPSEIKKIEAEETKVRLFLTLGETPLSFACSKGNLEIVKFLLESTLNINPNFDINAPLKDNGSHEGDTLIYLACAQGHLDVVEYLSNKHASLNDPIKNGYNAGKTLLYIATQTKNLEIVKFLTKFGINPKKPLTMINTSKMYEDGIKDFNDKNINKYKKTTSAYEIAKEDIRKYFDDQDSTSQNSTSQDNTSQDSTYYEELNQNSNSSINNENEMDFNLDFNLDNGLNLNNNFDLGFPDENYLDSINQQLQIQNNNEIQQISLMQQDNFIKQDQKKSGKKRTSNDAFGENKEESNKKNRKIE